jgi:hypothetical protein
MIEKDPCPPSPFPPLKEEGERVVVLDKESEKGYFKTIRIIENNGSKNFRDHRRY